MLSARSRRRLSSISVRTTSGRPLAHPPFVATMHPSGIGERALPIVSSLSPPVYVCAVSMWRNPAATASTKSATPVGVFLSRFVPSPIRFTSTLPSNTFVFVC